MQWPWCSLHGIFHFIVLHVTDSLYVMSAQTTRQAGLPQQAQQAALPQN
jgi:hypothetical protein